MLLTCWNVNGFRAVYGKTFPDFIQQIKPDVLALQEIKVQEDQLPLELETDNLYKPYKKYWFPAEKKGYAGTAIWSKIAPLSIKKGIDAPEFDAEGRVLIAEYEHFYFLSIYFPNSQPELARLKYRLAFNETLLKYCQKLRKTKGVILSGDFNVAHEAIDLTHPKANVNNPGFYIDERNWFSKLVAPETGYHDIFREEHPNEPNHYSWWTYRAGARQKNVGWRIDYFTPSQEVRARVKNSIIYKDIWGSDHAPIGLEIQ